MHFTIRPEWSPLTVLLLVMGFMTSIFLGIAILAYILWGSHLQRFADKFGGPLKKLEQRINLRPNRSSGDPDFIAAKNEIMDIYEEERQILSKEYQEIDAFLRSVQRTGTKAELDFLLKRKPKRRRRAASPRKSSL